MDESDSKNIPTLCSAGCGFYGNKLYDNMCSKCFKERNKNKDNKGEEPSAKIPTGNDSGESQSNTSASASPLVISRKHTRSPSPVAKSPSVTPTSTTDTTTTTTQPAPATPPADNTKPVQTNKGRCFKCRVKVPLAKQTINKCRCEYVFCDSHRYPDRHDCDVDFAKLDRDTLAKNNPKLHERPKGGRSFQRIDSL
ncbi:hypothetical protein VTP01DRAFT_5285 [Rhizomucor pusillus]|uniref:uncharacterized protein n=1 Tax=Rhizomucor pusillus TaxID=4840 RepID=UPI0037445D64